MKTLITAFFLLYSSVSSAAITLISDMDDTIKITNAGDFPTAAYNGVFTEKVFTGMPEFLGEARSYTVELHVVTAAPPVIGARIRDTLHDNGIDYDSVILRPLSGGISKLDFKVNAIKALIEDE